jgi:hypothetical protein
VEMEADVVFEVEVVAVRGVVDQYQRSMSVETRWCLRASCRTRYILAGRRRHIGGAVG